MTFRHVAISVAALLALSALSTLPLLRDQHLPPAPTEHRLDQSAEQSNRSNRHAYLEELHRTAPDTDWRTIERTNGAVMQAVRDEAARRDPQDAHWTELGSRNQAGRMHVAAFTATADSLYGGSSRGGVWKASLTGNAWRPLADNLWGGSHGLAIAGTTPEVVTSITDNGNLNYSEDAGQTWLQPTGIPGALNNCKRVSSDPSDPQRVLLLARNSAGTNLYVSRDAGRTYQIARPLTTNAGDFWLNRRTGGPIYLLDGNRVYRSDTSLLQWTYLGTAPFNSPDRVVLTGSEAGAPTLYAAARTSGTWRLYRSLDAGATWSYRYEIFDFWETLCASTTDPDLVAFAGVELWRSTNGGQSFTKANNWWDYYDDPVNMLHADFPGLDCIPTDDGRDVWYAATDGGLYRSTDGLATFTNISLTGLGVSQYYSTHTSINDPDLLLAGSQDQGYQRSTGAGRDGPTWDFDQLISGDYGHLTSSDGTHNIVYSVYPGFVLVQQGEQFPVLAGYLDFPPNESHSWMPFIVADPANARAFYFCGSRLHHASWLGGDNVYYNPSTQDFTVAGGDYLTAFGIAPADHDRRIAVVNNGRLWYTTDGGNQWRLSADLGPSAHYFYGTAIVHNASDPDRAFIGGSGYNGPGVWRTADGGATWEGAGSGLPSTLVYGLALETPTSDVLYAATEAGPYRLDPGTDMWEYIGGSRAPLTTYWCVEAVPAANVVRFGTYGRGIWDYATGVTGVEPEIATPVASLDLACAPNPFNPRTTVGFRMPAAGHATVAIHDAKGRRVALLRDGYLEAGQHEIVWNGRDTGGRDCSSGVYLVRVATPQGQASRSVALVR